MPLTTGGSANAKKRGLKPILLMFTPTEHQLIRVAAAMAGLPMTHFVHQVLMKKLSGAKND